MNYFKEYEIRKKTIKNPSGYESRYNSKGNLIYIKYSYGTEYWFDETSLHYINLVRSRLPNGTEAYYDERGNITKVIVHNPPEPIIIHE